MFDWWGWSRGARLAPNPIINKVLLRIFRRGSAPVPAPQTAWGNHRGIAPTMLKKYPLKYATIVAKLFLVVKRQKKSEFYHSKRLNLTNLFKLMFLPINKL